MPQRIEGGYSDKLETIMRMTRRSFLTFLGAVSLTGAAINQKRTGAAPKVTVINLFSVAGLQYYQGPQIAGSLVSGDTLRLIPEPGNAYDGFAVEIFQGKNKLGYVPRSDNRHISRMLAQGVNLYCEVLEVTPDRLPWSGVRVQVSLIEKV